ncbi:DUF1963 domain-containing protein [Sulfitobacter sp.]|nr:DUF1963 domain-containing protein [Sulfitobacter sp.]
MFGWLKKLTGGGVREAVTPPPVPVLPPEALSEDDLRLVLERPCAPIVYSKPANIDPFASMFGAVRLSRAGEVWPSFEGAPLWPLCQLNLTQAPFVPDALRDLALITVFIRDNDAHSPTQIINIAEPDPAATWALRAYSTLEGLTIPNVPKHQSTLSPRLGQWADQTADYPNHDMAGAVVDTAEVDVYAYDWSRTVQQTKLGGWPGTVQSEPWWVHVKTQDTWDFVMQIENEPKAGWSGWGDGAAYIARSRERPHLWAIDVQFT